MTVLKDRYTTATLTRAISTVVALMLVTGCGSDSDDRFVWPLPAIDGSFIDSSSLEENRASVFVFVAPDCPLSQNHTLTLNELAGQFAADAVNFYGVVAGEWYSRDETAEFVSTYRVAFPVLLDRDYRLTDFFGANVTPEVFVIDSAGRQRYQGAIDDWVGALAQHRPITTVHYLEDALTSIVNGETVAVESARALGCFIEREG